MKRIIFGVLVATALISSAEAKSKFSPIPADYDYAREKAPGYKKDYCEDSVGNHIMCAKKAKQGDDTYSATYR